MYKIQQLVTVFLQLVKGIMNVLVSAESMAELEEKIQRLVQETARQLLEWSLCEIDARLAKDREPGKYENKDIRSRTLVRHGGGDTGTGPLSHPREEDSHDKYLG